MNAETATKFWWLDLHISHQDERWSWFLDTRFYLSLIFLPGRSLYDTMGGFLAPIVLTIRHRQTVPFGSLS